MTRHLVSEIFVPLELPPSAAFFHRNLNGITPADYGPLALTAGCTFDGDFCSQDFLIAGDTESGRFLLVGALTADRSLTYLTLERRQGRFTGVRVRQPDIAVDAAPEELVVLEGSDWRDLMSEYAGRVAARAGITPMVPKENLTGYCSWYYYYTEFSSDKYQDIVAAIGAHREEFPCRVIQVDDGYQAHHGDWTTTHPRWRLTLEETADLARSAGCVPGIWLMPFLATTASEIFRAQPEWFVKDEKGEPHVVKGWSAPPDDLWACLDASQEPVREHIAGIFRELARIGFGYFKLDGTGMSLPAGRRSDPAATPLSAYRDGMRAIREAVPDAHIMGCGTPFLATLGLVDSVRVSPDTCAKWEAWGLPTEAAESEPPANEPCNFGVPCLRNALHYSLSKWWMADRWFRNDPDCVIVRDDKSSLTEGESRISALTAILTGIAITSDHPGHMSSARRALFARAAGLRLRDARPLDTMPGRWPQRFSGTVEGAPAVAWINDSESPVSCHPSDLGLVGPVTEVLHPLGPVSDSFTISPHDAILLVGS